MMAQPDIDQLYYKITNMMSADSNTLGLLSLKLRLMKTNSERVQLVHQNIEKYKMFPKYVNTDKNTDVSKKYRDLGNRYYENKKNADALKMYNLAIMNAPSNTKELCLAYSNRSAVNYTLKNYSACLEDIERAMSLHCNTKLQEKLINRKMLCCEAFRKRSAINYALKNYTECLKDIERVMALQCDSELQDELLRRKILCEKEDPTSNADNIDDLCKKQFKLTKDQNAIIPSASVSLKLTYSEKTGHGVIATQDILPGEVLALEDPYCCIVLEPYYTEYCYGCLKQSDSMIPCPDCCSVMFCDEECRLKAFKDFHKIDCKLMHLLSVMKFTKIELTALRTVIQAKCTHGKCISLKNVISEAESVKDPLLKGFTVDSRGKRIFDSNNYSPIHMKESHIQKRDISDIFQKCVTAAVFLHLLLNHTPFFDECGLGDDADNKCLKEDCTFLYGGLLLHLNMISAVNMENISTISPSHTAGYTNDENFAAAGYAFTSFFNHSCAPNISKPNSGTSKAVIAIRPIKKGQEIFDNYGPHYATDSFRERQERLKFQYKFACECVACMNKWPMVFVLPRAKVTNREEKIFLSKNLLTEKLKNKLTNGNKKAALDIVNQLYLCVSMLDKYAPCMDLIDYLESIKQCWALFGNVAPLR